MVLPVSRIPHPQRSLLATAFAGAAVLATVISGCKAACEAGFNRGDDGLCRAEVPCPPGASRGTDLACHPYGDSGTPAATTDSGSPTDQPPLDTGTADAPDDDVPSTGPGRIRIVYDQLAGLPLHGMVVFAERPGGGGPIASFCQIILADPMDIEGQMVPFDGTSDPCPSAGDAVIFDEGAIELTMSVSQGASESPVLCDQRVVAIAGDQTVDYSTVTGCDQ